ncbi:MAG: hypothetical protein MZV63_23630 [Marinilabiliales bacterium]|nr:hypothetical protein [Marinilabiliales bacterium]
MPLVNASCKPGAVADLRHRLPPPDVRSVRQGDEEGRLHGLPQRDPDPGPRRARGRHRLDRPAHHHGLRPARRQGSADVPGPQQPGPVPERLDPRVEGLRRAGSHWGRRLLRGASSRERRRRLVGALAAASTTKRTGFEFDLNSVGKIDLVLSNEGWDTT